MRQVTLSLLTLLLLTPIALAQKQFGFDNRKSSGQPYMTPAETVAKFKVAPEFEVKLFAGEPQVVNPIAFTIDEKGRVWVIESFEYPSRTPKGKAPRDRIVILEDTDGDGVCDKRTVFAEGKDFPVTEERKKAGLGAFDLASGIEVGHGGVFVGAAPYLWFIENKNDKPGKFEVLLKGFGSQDTHEMLNTFLWGPDGWLYGCHGIYTNSDVSAPDAQAPSAKMNAAYWRYHPRTKKFEIFAEGTSNPWGLDWRNTDGQFISCCCVIPHLFHIVPGGYYKRQSGPGSNPYAYGYINEICDHTFHKESGWAHAGLMSLDVPHMPEKYRDSVIFGSIHGCSLKRNVLKSNGSTYTASGAEDFLQSGDKNVRPINLRWGPLGDIYMIDWHDQNPCHQAAADSWDYEHGRVYRIQLKGTTPKKAEDLGKKEMGDLQDMACSADEPYTVRTALRLLSERADNHLSKPKVKSRGGFSAYASVGARGMSRSHVELSTSFTGEYAFMAVHLINYLSQKKTENDNDWSDFRQPPERFLIWDALAKMAKEHLEPVVRRELASAVIRNADKDEAFSVARALMEHKGDAKDPALPHLIWLGYEKLMSFPGRKGRLTEEGPLLSPYEIELPWLRDHAAGNPLITDHIITRVMRRLAATGKPDNLALCIKFVKDVKDSGVRAKALEGLATELAGQAVTPPETWATLRDELAKDAALVPFVNKLSVNFRDPAAARRAMAAAKDTALKTEQRVEAVRQLGALKANESLPLLLDLLRTDAANPVRVEAVRALAGFQIQKLSVDLLKNWKDYPREVQAELVNVLASRKESAKALLAAMSAKTVDRAIVSDNTILRIQAFKDKELNALIEKAWGRTRPTPADLEALIEKTRKSFSIGGASFARGKLVFDNQCAKCHKFEGRGADVGPALDGAARDIDYILVNVLDPNRVIGAPYFLRIARTVDGRVEQGVLAEEDDRFVTLKSENGVLKKIAKADLEGPLQTVEKSLMPEGLTAGMKEQDFRDLIRYLMASPFLTDVAINGNAVSVGLSGQLSLPGGKGEPTVVEAEVTAAADTATQLMVGVSADYEVRLDGALVALAQKTNGPIKPDQAAHPITLTKGTHRLTLIVKDKGIGGTVFARFLLDPDRKLSYPDPGAKK